MIHLIDPNQAFKEPGWQKRRSFLSSEQVAFYDTQGFLCSYGMPMLVETHSKPFSIFGAKDTEKRLKPYIFSSPLFLEEQDHVHSFSKCSTTFRIIFPLHKTYDQCRTSVLSFKATDKAPVQKVQSPINGRRHILHLILDAATFLNCRDTVRVQPNPFQTPLKKFSSQNLLDGQLHLLHLYLYLQQVFPSENICRTMAQGPPWR